MVSDVRWEERDKKIEEQAADKLGISCRKREIYRQAEDKELREGRGNERDKQIERD